MTILAGSTSSGRSVRAMMALQWCLCRMCWQVLDPPHSLHLLNFPLCSQMLVPPHSLHLLLLRLCSQMLAPPHSLHWLLCRLCSQMLAPPHSLHLLRRRLCSHFTCDRFLHFRTPLLPPLLPSGTARFLLPFPLARLPPPSPFRSSAAPLPPEPPDCPQPSPPRSTMVRARYAEQCRTGSSETVPALAPVPTKLTYHVTVSPSRPAANRSCSNRGAI